MQYCIKIILAIILGAGPSLAYPWTSFVPFCVQSVIAPGFNFTQASLALKQQCEIVPQVNPKFELLKSNLIKATTILKENFASLITCLRMLSQVISLQKSRELGEISLQQTIEQMNSFIDQIKQTPNYDDVCKLLSNGLQNIVDSIGKSITSYITYAPSFVKDLVPGTYQVSIWYMNNGSTLATDFKKIENGLNGWKKVVINYSQNNETIKNLQIILGDLDASIKITQDYAAKVKEPKIVYDDLQKLVESFVDELFELFRNIINNLPPWFAEL